MRSQGTFCQGISFISDPKKKKRKNITRRSGVRKSHMQVTHAFYHRAWSSTSNCNSTGPRCLSIVCYHHHPGSFRLAGCQRLLNSLGALYDRLDNIEGGAKVREENVWNFLPPAVLCEIRLPVSPVHDEQRIGMLRGGQVCIAYDQYFSFDTQKKTG